jgi:hypothetical protein
MGLDELITTFRQRKLQIDCRDMVLVQEGTPATPIRYRGKGYIRQEDDDTLSFRLYATQIENVDAASELTRFLSGRPGEIYAPTEHYTLTALDTDNAIWTSERLLVEGKWRFEEDDPIMYGALATLAIDKPTASTDHTLRLDYFEDADLPTIIDHAEFKAAGVDFSVHKGSGEFHVEARATEDFPPSFATRIEEGLRFLLARSVTHRVRVSTDRGRYQLQLHGAQPQSRKPRIDPPLTRVSPAYYTELWRLFDLYLTYVIRETPHHQYWNIVSYHLHNACEASANSIDAWAIGLSVAVEGICSLIPMELAKDERSELDGLRKFINAQVKEHQDYKALLQRVKGMTQQLLTMRAIDKLRRLADEGKVLPDYVTAWHSLRNKQVHPGPPDLADGTKLDYQPLFDQINCVCVLLYHLVFYLIGYEGTYTDFGARGWPLRTYPPGHSASQSA